MAVTSVTMRVLPLKPLGAAIADMLNGLRAVESDQRATVIAVVPTRFTFCRFHEYRVVEEYVVTEADVLIEWRPL